MLQSKFGKARGLAISAMVATCLAIAACGGRGDTAGDSNNDALGDQFVSDGAAGGTLSIRISGPLSVGGTVGFSVTARDPSGAPLAFIRIFCESEHGIAILEPSRGGVAFESTGGDGLMSGVLGGITPGSYLLECRGPQGFNLLDREQIVITGEVPEGFVGFPGAAGGNLGGGLIVEAPDSDDIGAVSIREVRFIDVTGEATRNGQLDIVRNPDCNNDGITTDPEPYGFDNYQLTISNRRDDRINVTAISFTVFDGRPVVSSTQLGGLVIEPGSEIDLIDSFTEFVFGSSTKTYAGTSATVLPGTYNVTFTVTALTADGDSITLTQSAVLTIGDVNNC